MRQSILKMRSFDFWAFIIVIYLLCFGGSVCLVENGYAWLAFPFTTLWCGIVNFGLVVPRLLADDECDPKDDRML